MTEQNTKRNGKLVSLHPRPRSTLLRRSAWLDQAKTCCQKADSLLTLPADQLQAKVDKYLGAVRGFQIETDENGKPDRVSLARLVGRYLLDSL